MGKTSKGLRSQGLRSGKEWRRGPGQADHIQVPASWLQEALHPLPRACELLVENICCQVFSLEIFSVYNFIKFMIAISIIMVKDFKLLKYFFVCVCVQGVGV